MKKSILVNHKEILKRHKPMDSKTHKGIQGHAFLIGGSYGKMGAMTLSSKACLKTGCGLVTVFIPKCGYEIIQTAVPEVMVLTDDYVEHIENIAYDFVPKAIGIGPGMGQKPETQKGLHEFLNVNTIPLVIDADALNILAKNRDWLDE